MSKTPEFSAVFLYVMTTGWIYLPDEHKRSAG
jgi:hypothetical protein